MKRALISVSDKTNLVPFVKGLVGNNYQIISTGGTKLYLEEHGIKVISVEEVTSSPEILDGRVKTLHPNIHGAILCDRSNESHLMQIEELNIELIDLVVVNLYPFIETISSNCTIEEAIEKIDIGGPSMLRSAAKNFKNVCVVCDYNDYDNILDELLNNGEISITTRSTLSAKAFRHTAKYDSYIANYLSEDVNESLTVSYDLAYELRYGENPHQSAQFYQDNSTSFSLANANILHGKKLSYNNLLDASAALNIVKEFEECVVVAIKHTNPCGVGIDSNIYDAYIKAYNADSVSIFGGIVASNKCITKEVALEMSKIFLEIIIAPDFDDDALEILKQKKNLRILKVNMQAKNNNRNIVSINGGILVQDSDGSTLSEYEVINGTDIHKSDFEFAWKVCKHIKSNAICVVKDGMTIGIGAGQMSRVGSCKIALEQAKTHNISELVLASDAFFPFDDAIDLAYEYGVKTIIQPGGSVNDNLIIDKCKEYGINLIFTGIRNFKH